MLDDVVDEFEIPEPLAQVSGPQHANPRKKRPAKQRTRT